MKLTIDEKRAIVVEHYERSYKNIKGNTFRVNPNLSPELVEEYYQNILKLGRSEQNHREKKNAQAFLKLVT